MKLVLLPGLDGTGDLFESFHQALPDNLDVQVVLYPFKATLDYSVLAEYVLDILPVDEPFVLLGESFSGPIAVAIAASKPPMMRGLILVNTFLENPRPLLLKLAKFSPDRLLTSPPQRMLQCLLKNPDADALSVEQLTSTISGLSPELVKSRLAAISDVDVRAGVKEVSVPVCILRSKSDTAIATRVANNLVKAFAQSTVHELDTDHFLLQAKPLKSARLVDEFIRESCSSC